MIPILEQYIHQNLEQMEAEIRQQVTASLAAAANMAEDEDEEYEGVELREEDLLELARRRVAYMSELGSEPIEQQYRFQMRQREMEQEMMEREASPSPNWSSGHEYGMQPFSEVIPHFWREEILEAPDSPLKQPMMYALMQGFGSLACYLYTRILKICKESKDDNT